jgi:hypothetical protein
MARVSAGRFPICPWSALAGFLGQIEMREVPDFAGAPGHAKFAILLSPNVGPYFSAKFELIFALSCLFLWWAVQDLGTHFILGQLLPSSRLDFIDA